jgi:hypothetical protein
MTTVTLDALDAVELTEIPDYFIERLDVLADNDLATLLFTQCSPYDIDDFRADVARLIHRADHQPICLSTDVGASLGVSPLAVSSTSLLAPLANSQAPRMGRDTRHRM